MKRSIKFLLSMVVVVTMLSTGNYPIQATPIDTSDAGGFVHANTSGGALPIDSQEMLISSQAILIDGAFTFNTSGTYPTINENLNNGFEVEIISGGGDLTLTGNQVANLRINNANAPINIINGNLTKSLYLNNADVHLVNTRIDTTNNYGIDVNSHVRLQVDATSYVRSQNGYSSAIIVNTNQIDIQFVIDGIVESNQQTIGVDNGAKVDSIIINGKLISNANYGLVSATGEIGYVHFTSSSEAINPAGIVVYVVSPLGKVGDVVLDGTIDTRVIVTVGTTGGPARAGNITLNNQAIVRAGAFYLNGVISSLQITPQASINQLINNYGILYTREGTVIDQYQILGDITASFLLVDLYATSNIKEIVVDPVGINASAIVTVNSMLWISGHVNSLKISSSVFEVSGMNAPFNFRQTAEIDSMIVDQSIIDTKVNIPGILFNNQALSNVGVLQLNDALLFGEANDLEVAGQPLAHIEPTILTTNLVSNDGVVTLDVEIPELLSLPDISTVGVKLTYMFDDYSHQSDFMYYGGVQTITIPSSVINSAQPFYIVNYAQFSLNDDVVLTSNRSQYYEVASYFLNFELNGGQGIAPATQQLVEGGFAVAVSNPVRPGFIFNEWNTAQDGSGTTWDFATTPMPANDVTLYAQWSINTYNLSFDVNGGDSSAPAPQAVDYGALASEPTIPTKLGATFIEWNTAQDGSGTTWDFAATPMPANDVTLYAQWSTNQYEMRFDVNGGDSTAPAPQAVDYGAVAGESTIPTKLGSTFIEWNTAQDGSGTTWNFATTPMPANDVTLYAQWSTNQYEMRFDVNGGDSVAPAPQAVDYGALASEPTIPTKLGSTFIEWNTAQDGSGTTWNFATTPMPANDVTLYAQWSTNKYVLDFDVNGGDSSAPETQTLNYGALAIEPVTPTKLGSTFIAWNTAQDGSGLDWNFAVTTMGADDVTLYAQWKTAETSETTGSSELPKTGYTNMFTILTALGVTLFGCMLFLLSQNKKS